jgi:hypothetical protein
MGLGAAATLPTTRHLPILLRASSKEQPSAWRPGGDDANLVSRFFTSVLGDAFRLAFDGADEDIRAVPERRSVFRSPGRIYRCRWNGSTSMGLSLCPCSRAFASSLRCRVQIARFSRRSSLLTEWFTELEHRYASSRLSPAGTRSRWTRRRPEADHPTRLLCSFRRFRGLPTANAGTLRATVIEEGGEAE